MTTNNSLFQKIAVYVRELTDWLHVLFRRLFPKSSSHDPFKKMNPIGSTDPNELLNAVNQGDLLLVKKLLDEKKVNIKDVDHAKLLAVCISNENKKEYTIKYEILEYLIKQGIDLKKSIHPYGLLDMWEFAFEWLDLKLINLLLNASVPVTDETLNRVAYFLQSKSFSNKNFGHRTNSIDYRNQFGYSFSNKQAAKAFGTILDLFSKTANLALNPNSELQRQYILGYFIRNGHIDVINRTLGRINKANPIEIQIYRMNSSCIPIVELAAQYNQTEMAKLLINFYNTHQSIFKSKLPGNDYREHEMLMNSIRSNNLEIFDLLLNSPNFEINSVGDSLYFAMKNKNYNMVQLLLDKGASFGEEPYSEDKIADIITFKAGAKVLLCSPQHGLSNHLPPPLVNIVGDYLIPDDAPKDTSTLPRDP